MGYFARKSGSTSERDPLYATALVLDDGQDRVALLSCDLLWVHPSLVDEVSYSFAYYCLPAPLAPECAQRIIDEGHRLLATLPG